MATAITTTTTTTNPAKPKTQLLAAFHQAQNPSRGGGGEGSEGGGGGSGGGGGRGGGGSGGRGGGAPPPLPTAALIPVQPAADLKTIGDLPTVFDGDRAKADASINELKAYVRVNRGVLGFDSSMRNISLTLTLIKEPNVEGWAREIGDLIQWAQKLLQCLAVLEWLQCST